MPSCRKSSAAACALLCACALLPSPAGASPFLSPTAPAVHPDAQILLEELGRVLGDKQRARAEERVVRLTLALMPTFQSLPQTAEGRLGPAAVRYLLHRYFVDRHGWYVQGLEAGGQSWNSSSPTEALGRSAGSEVRSIFEERLGTRGLSLNEAAVFAATLEGLVHKEMLDRLRAAYRLTNTSEGEGGVGELRVATILDTYMLMYVMGLNHSAMTRWDILMKTLTVDYDFPQYRETLRWVNKVRGEVVASSSEPRTTFATTARVLEEVADRYGRWQDQECLKLKDTLVKLEQPGTGRIPLVAFYGAALKGNWQLSESKAYLRQMGALDESDARQPSVVIPNYVNGPSNCVAASSYYSVCCISECEAIQGHLERRLAAPDAEPGRIAEVVSALPSSTVPAPRPIPAELERRLGDIATRHGGRVPLHGRLFAQWLHHAYPLECPFPHLSGSLRPVTMEKWLQQTGTYPQVNATYMRGNVEEILKGLRPGVSTAPRMPWIEQEELFVGTAPPGAPISMSAADFGQGLLLVATVVSVSMAVTLARSLARARSALAAQPGWKLSV